MLIAAGGLHVAIYIVKYTVVIKVYMYWMYVYIKLSIKQHTLYYLAQSVYIKYTFNNENPGSSMNYNNLFA